MCYCEPIADVVPLADQDEESIRRTWLSFSPAPSLCWAVSLLGHHVRLAQLATTHVPSAPVVRSCDHVVFED